MIDVMLQNRISLLNGFLDVELGRAVEKERSILQTLDEVRNGDHVPPSNNSLPRKSRRSSC